MKKGFFATVLFAALLAGPAMAQTYEYKCTYKGDAKKDQPFYGKAITVKIDGENASLKGSGKDNTDSGTLSSSAKKYKRPRFFGFQKIADCADGNYMEADPGILTGEGGEVEFTGPGNEDCAAGDDTYTCK
jgi:hypothetical protein